jgi:hypothetical protein
MVSTQRGLLRLCERYSASQSACLRRCRIVHLQRDNHLIASGFFDSWRRDLEVSLRSEEFEHSTLEAQVLVIIGTVCLNDLLRMDCSAHL